MRKFLLVINSINEYVYPPIVLIFSGFFYDNNDLWIWIYLLICTSVYFFIKTICKRYNKRHSNEPLISFKYEEILKEHSTEVSVGKFLLLLLVILISRHFNKT